MSSYRYITYFTLIMATIAIVVYAPHAAHAQQVTFGVDPTILELQTPPDRLTQSSITLTNPTSTAQTVRIYPERFVHGREDEVDVEYDTLYDAKSWIVMSGQESLVTLPPSSTTTVPLRIRPPTGSTPGDHYLSLIIEPMSPGSSPEVGVITRVAVQLFLHVPGLITTSYKLKALGTHDIYESTLGSIPFILVNTGNSRARPDISLQIISSTSSRTISIPRVTLLPGVLRSIDVTLPEPLSTGVYTLKLTVAGTPLGTRTVYIYPVKRILVSVVAALSILCGYVVMGSRRRQTSITLDPLKSYSKPRSTKQRSSQD